jgi:hypothetical protein
MERLVQYLDDLEDIYFAMALVMERVRRVVQLSLLLVVSFGIPFFGVLLALSRPPLALAVVSLTVVGMLYRGVTIGHRVQSLARIP